MVTGLHLCGRMRGFSKYLESSTFRFQRRNSVFQSRARITRRGTPYGEKLSKKPLVDGFMEQKDDVGLEDKSSRKSRLLVFRSCY